MDTSLRKIIEDDLFRYFGARKLSIKQRISAFIKPELRYQMSWRKYVYYKEKKSIKRFYYKFTTVWLSHKFGFQISADAKVGNGLYIGHFGRLIMGGNIGKNLNVATGVTIGGVAGKMPTIGDNVFIGTNAVVVGNIKIGDNVLISPNTFLFKSVPSNSIVTGNPAIIFPKNNATAACVNNRV